MIAYVEGRLEAFGSTSCLVVTQGGVGYEVNLSGRALAHLPERGTSVSFYTCLIVREDAQELYGFETWDERQTFIVLTSITRVGARTALAILTIFTPDDLRQLVAEDDAASLTRVPGIGKKTAQLMFLELKDKLKGSITGGASVTKPKTQASMVFRDALDGLMGLGYTESEAAPVLQGVLQAEPDLDVSGALRASLKALAKERTKG